MSNMGTAVVTGASSGIGREYAVQLAKRGFALQLVARRADRLKVLAEELQSKYGVQARAVVADLGEEQGVSEVTRIMQDTEDFALLVNNAGLTLMGEFEKTDLREMHRLLQLNIKVVVDLSYAALRQFQQVERGTLINIGSVLAFSGYPGTTLCSASKAFLLAFTQGLQAEHTDNRIRIQLVAPAGVATEGWDSSVVDPALIMSAEKSVAASLAGLDMGEAVALPSVEDPALLPTFLRAGQQLMMAAQTNVPASRYRKS